MLRRYLFWLSSAWHHESSYTRYDWFTTRNKSHWPMAMGATADEKCTFSRSHKNRMVSMEFATTAMLTSFDGCTLSTCRRDQLSAHSTTQQKEFAKVIKSLTFALGEFCEDSKALPISLSLSLSMRCQTMLAWILVKTSEHFARKSGRAENKLQLSRLGIACNRISWSIVRDSKHLSSRFVCSARFEPRRPWAHRKNKLFCMQPPQPNLPFFAPKLKQFQIIERNTRHSHSAR